MDQSNQIKCPNCNTTIDVQHILASQIEQDMRQKLAAQAESMRQKQMEAQSILEREKADFEDKKRKENQLFQDKLERQMREEKKLIEERVRLQITQEQKDQYDAMQLELNDKSEKLKELNQSKAEIEKLKREKLELKATIEAESQKLYTETLRLEADRIRKSTEESWALKLKEKDKQLEDQMKLTEEMKRKQEQGSMQLQGEVLELAIEEYLALQFPLDSIEEIKKGAKGADCLQIVNTRIRHNCGKIYYESKRTKDFQSSWIEKFKADMREKDADVGVLVTEAMPAGMDRLGQKDGVWICTFDEFKGLSKVLRETVIQVSVAMASQENKGDKMHLLYDYLTGSNFRMQVEAIVEGFTAMKTALDSEKRSMQRIWKEREKQIEKVIDSTIDMHANIRGIAGSAVQAVKALELGPSDVDDLEV